jgi:hypothetical protein
MEEGEEEVGPSNMPTKRKGKQPIQRSPHKHPEVSIVLPCIPEGVQATAGLLGCIDKLRYADHDVSDTGKFPEFMQQVYMEILGTGPLGDPVLQPKQWIAGLFNTGIMNFLEIPHFGRGKYVNNCIKKLLAVLHGGFLWMDRSVSIDVELISFITGLPSDGEKPMQYMDDKTKEKALMEEMKNTYGTERGSRGIIIKRISDPTTRMETKLMACKLLQKCHKEEVPTGVIVAAARSAQKAPC